LFLLVSAALGSRTLHDTLHVSATDEASLRIEEADNAVRHAFAAVLEAERTGANVSCLIEKLGEAGTYLGKAETAYVNGNVSEAAAAANGSLLIAENVTSEALDLKSSALNGSSNTLWLDAAFSLSGASTLVIVLSFVWRRFKRVRVRKLLEIKPEVESDVKS
jgi:hypothetical protein